MICRLLALMVCVRAAQAINQLGASEANSGRIMRKQRRDGAMEAEISNDGVIADYARIKRSHAKVEASTKRNQKVPVLIRVNAECLSDDTPFGSTDTLQACADLVNAAGGEYLVYGRAVRSNWTGYGDRNNRTAAEAIRSGNCWQEHPTSADCPEGYETDAYNVSFYRLEDPPPATAAVQGDNGGLDLTQSDVQGSYKFDANAVAPRAPNPCAELGCPEAVDNCTYLTGATISMQLNNGTCAEAETMVSLGDKDGNNGMITDLVGCIAVVQQNILDPVPTCTDRFTQNMYTKECKCLAPATAGQPEPTCTPTPDPDGAHCLWWMVYK